MTFRAMGAAIFISGGASVRFSGVAPFIPRMKLPLLMLNGRYDDGTPVDTSQRLLFDLAGAPPEHKRHVIYEDAGHHPLPRGKMISEIVTWLDRYQGPVGGAGSARP